jgi:hypothetical protein
MLDDELIFIGFRGGLRDDVRLPTDLPAVLICLRCMKWIGRYGLLLSSRPAEV